MHSNEAASAPTGLQTEWCIDPVGVDESRPRLRWIVAAEDGQIDVRQYGYHVIVEASSYSGTLDVVWDSGVVWSRESSLVEYSGAPLRSNTTYLWRVRTFGPDGHASAWSPPAKFTTGMLSQEDWNGSEWLTHPTASNDKYVWFRSLFSLPDPLVRPAVLVNVASIGYHTLFINGRKADPERELAPPLMNYFKRVPYVTYDVSELLVPGLNAIGVWTAAGWAANRGFSMRQSFRLKMVGSVLDESGAIVPVGVSSATSWLCSESDAESTELVTRWEHNGGERIDARRSSASWNQVSFDDSGWLPAGTTLVDSPCTSTFRVPKTAITNTFEPIAVRETSDGWRAEFPTNFTGWVEFAAIGQEEGDIVTILTSDDEETVCDFNQRSYLVCGGSGHDSFRPRFGYAAGRFVTIQGLTRAPESVRAFALATDFERTGHFRSSNDLYNKIFETDLWTFQANTPEGFTMDCPHRERMGYGETATSTSWGVGIPNYAAGAFYTKIVQDWVDVQDEDGYIPHVAPVPEHEHWGGPMWSSAGLNVAYEHYLSFGDTRVLSTVLPSARGWLDFLHANTTDGLLKGYGDPNHFLGDWLAPDSRIELGDSPEAALFNNLVYAWNLKEMQFVCRALGLLDESQVYESRYNLLRVSIISKWFDASTGDFLDGRQVQQAFPLLVGLLEGDHAELARHRLDQEFSRRRFLDMGSAGVSALLRFVVDSRAASPSIHVAEMLNQTSYPGYGYFLAQGETTWPEDWNSKVESRIHTCYSGIAGWFIKALGGIRPDPEHPGYRRFLVRPIVVPQAEWAEAAIESPYGLIKSRWERTGQSLTLTVVVPPNSEADVDFMDIVQVVGSGTYSWTTSTGDAGSFDEHAS